MNLMMLLEMAAGAYGDRVAFQNGEDRLTYQQLFEAAGVLAGSLDDGRTKHLAMLDVSTLAMPIALFGASWAGIPFAPLNYRLTDAELDSLIAQLQPGRLITDAERASRLGSRLDASEGDDFVEVAERDAVLGEVRAQGAESRETPWSMEPEDTAILLFTSGTTGAPKAAVLRQKHLVSYVLGTVEFMGADEADAALVCVPPYHIAGMSSIASSVYSGRRVIQLPNFTAEAWLEAARANEISHAFVVPTMLARIVDALEGEETAGLPSLRALSYGGGKMPQTVIERAMRLFPETDFTNAYGLTETSSTITLLGPGDHRDAMASEDEAVRRRIVSVGQPLPTIEVSIRDAETGEPLAAGERGLIYVRGEQVSGEYRGKGSLLDEAGWFNTRDGGYLDDGGYLFLEGRMDDVIVRGGENMSPGEIEDVLMEHPSVLDVAVVGIPDEQWGEAVGAVIVQSDAHPSSVGELQQWVKDRLRSSRTPERIEFWPELPYNETGKLLRRKVREALRDSG
ncbi:MAG: acyl--CoA ligase [Deltaproteobacteria bacterium]|jgi:acyl-CoA synthetase (AMP-forming)/AMP-acid ligase II|nr:acyl--CoA ligase [Deltaproteobacteria bacterium]